jgi:hypothetical protein
MQMLDGWKKEQNPTFRILAEMFDDTWLGKLADKLWAGQIGEHDPPGTKYPLRVHLGTAAYVLNQWWVSRRRITRRRHTKIKV